MVYSDAYLVAPTSRLTLAVQIVPGKNEPKYELIGLIRFPCFSLWFTVRVNENQINSARLWFK